MPEHTPEARASFAAGTSGDNDHHLHGERGSTNLGTLGGQEANMRKGATLFALLAVVLPATGCAPDAQPEPFVDDTATSVTSTVPDSDSSEASSSTTVPVETVEDFFDGFVGSYQTGNPVFLIQRIHPELRMYYGREACRAVYEDFVPDDTARVTIRSISESGPWSEVFDDDTFTFEDVRTVDVEFVDFGRTRRQDMRLAQIENRYYFFQDCGEPLISTGPIVDEDALDPDGDGFYYVHVGAGDSEDFTVPEMFRITYTGSASTCTFALVDSAAGSEVRYITGLENGGMKRVVLADPLTTLYISDVIGCGGGSLQVGPNP